MQLLADMSCRLLFMYVFTQPLLHQQDVIQSQLVWIQSFPSPRPIAILSLQMQKFRSKLNSLHIGHVPNLSWAIHITWIAEGVIFPNRDYESGQFFLRPSFVARIRYRPTDIISIRFVVSFYVKMDMM